MAAKGWRSEPASESGPDGMGTEVLVMPGLPGGLYCDVANSSDGGEKGLDELPGIERGQVTEVLSRADEENWHLQFLLDGKDYSPTGRAVQLGQEDARCIPPPPLKDLA